MTNRIPPKKPSQSNTSKPGVASVTPPASRFSEPPLLDPKRFTPYQQQIVIEIKPEKLR